MDFKGQNLSESLGQYLVIAFAGLSFLLGYFLQSFSLMMKVFTGGVGVAFVATVVDWPIYNKNPVAWRRPAQSAGGRGPSSGGRPSPRTAANFWKLFG